MASYKAVSRFDGRFWTATIERPDGSLAGGLQTTGLDLVADKARDLVEDADAEVAVEVTLPAATEQRLELAEQLAEDATREVERAIIELRADGMAVGDIGFLLLLRRLRPEPKAIVVTNAELAKHGLSQHPDAVGVRWSDHGFAETTKCRGCLEATQGEYLGLAEVGTNELLYNGVACDFCDEGHPDDDSEDLLPAGD